jgi:hypothetical protein
MFFDARSTSNGRLSIFRLPRITVKVEGVSAPEFRETPAYATRGLEHPHTH